LNNYSYKPHFCFFGEREDGYPMGVELEMDNSKRIREFMCKSMCEEIYFKTDASLSNGVEVVTHPCTLTYHLKVLPWKKILNAAKSSGLRSHTGSTRDPGSKAPTCGLHIHVNKHAFGITLEERDTRQAKLLVLFDKFWDKIVIFSRRDANSIHNWAKRYADFDVSKEQLDTIIKKAKGTSGRDRRMAVNICNQSRGGEGDQPTVEFRIFRGTLNIETVFASLQLIALLIEDTNRPTVEVQQMTWEEFRDRGMEKYSEFGGYITRLQKMGRKI